jgi:hypothetical protein
LFGLAEPHDQDASIGAVLLGSALLGVLLPAAPAQAACTTTINSVTVPEVII